MCSIIGFNQKKYGDIFPENIINAIKIRAAKGKIRNYQSYEKIFEWYWKYKKGSVIFDSKRTLDILRYSDDFCNRLFELWCLHSIKETCQCVLDTQGIDGKTSEVLGNYKKEKQSLSKKINQDDEDSLVYQISEKNHKVISNLFSYGELAEELPKQMDLLRQNYFPHIWDNMSQNTKEILAMADCLFSGMKSCENADYAPICLEYCRGLEVQLNQLIFEPFRSGNNINTLTQKNRFYEKMKEPRDLTLGECVFLLEKCTHKHFPMTELRRYVERIVSDSNIFFADAVPKMREINTNIRRLSAHTTIMSYEELVITRQKILGIGYLNLFYQLLDQR